MLLFRSLPNLADTPVNRDFRRFFYSKWGREICIFSARATIGEYPPYTQRLSIKAAWGGSERYYLNGRTVAVDDDNYLVINDQRTYGSVLKSEKPLHTFSIFFSPGMAEETLGALFTSSDRALDLGSDPVRRPIEFSEQLRPHDSLVSPILPYIAHHVDSGLNDEIWYEEQLSFLLERMLRAQRAAMYALESLNSARPSTRKEILRRIGWSTDYINTYYMHPLNIGDLAKSASLSRFHFIRLFRAIHRVTPFAYLQRKRAVVAKRLLLSTDLDQNEIALRVGFESRSTMFRQLRRLTGTGARSLRQAAQQRQFNAQSGLEASA